MARQFLETIAVLHVYRRGTDDFVGFFYHPNPAALDPKAKELEQPEEGVPAFDVERATYTLKRVS